MPAKEAGTLGAETKRNPVATRSPLARKLNLRARRRAPSTRRGRLVEETGASLTKTRRTRRGKTETSTAALATVETGTTDRMDPRTATEETGGVTKPEEAPTTTGLETPATENQRTAATEERRTTAETPAKGQGTRTAEVGAVGAAAAAAAARETIRGTVRVWDETAAPALQGRGQSSGNNEEEAREVHRTPEATAAGG